MDRRTRGFIEKGLDELLRSEAEHTEAIQWILEADVIIRSPEDLALGYILGYFASWAYRVVREKRVKRIYSDKTTTLETKKRLAQRSLPERDVIAVREMLRLRLPDIRRRIYRELGA